MRELQTGQIVLHKRFISANDGACLHAAGFWVNDKAVSHECDRLDHDEDLHRCNCGYEWSIYSGDPLIAG